MLFAPRRRAKMSAIIISLAAAPALAENPAPVPQASADAATTTITLDTIEVISQELNAARLQIQPSLGASTYTFSPEALADHSAGRKRALEPGSAADARRRAGQFWPNPCPRRACQCAIPDQRRAIARRSFGLWPGARNPFRQQHFTAYRRPAGAIWISDRRRSGHSDQNRAHQSGLRALDVWRKLQLAAAEFRIWRARRPGRLVLDRRLFG